MRWLVTGATGFIGATLVERLLARGDEVRALVRDPGRATDLRAMGAELVRGDVAQPDSLLEAVPEVDVVVHLAGLVKALTREELFAVNAQGTRSLAAVAARSGRTKFILLSSLAAAGPSTPGRPRTETDRPAPVSMYGQSKLAAEDALRSFAPVLHASIIRPPIVYGPRDKEFLPSLFRLARTGVIAKSGLGEKHYSLIHVDDLVAMVIDVAERGARVDEAGSSGIYFCADGVDYTWEALARGAMGALGKRGTVVAVPEMVTWIAAGASSAVARLTGRPAILSLDKMMEIREPAWTCSSEKARRELGWTPRVSFVDGMRDAVRWFRERGLV
ncbi:MAG: oxidoreductase, short chain dehydrogenase/reductase family [Anaeromyxobacteraceae bacterium]|nr:oxidoreductase, short chain dehydrogenase/reductase family [Anaeromyxobacteraceae bacterium]